MTNGSSKNTPIILSYCGYRIPSSGPFRNCELSDYIITRGLVYEFVHRWGGPLDWLAIKAYGEGAAAWGRGTMGGCMLVPPIRAWGEGPQEVGGLAPGWGLMELAGPREGLAEVGWMGKEATGGWLW